MIDGIPNRTGPSIFTKRTLLFDTNDWQMQADACKNPASSCQVNRKTMFRTTFSESVPQKFARRLAKSLCRLRDLPPELPSTKEIPVRAKHERHQPDCPLHGATWYVGVWLTTQHPNAAFSCRKCEMWCHSAAFVCSTQAPKSSKDPCHKRTGSRGVARGIKVCHLCWRGGREARQPQ